MSCEISESFKIQTFEHLQTLVAFFYFYSTFTTFIVHSMPFDARDKMFAFLLYSDETTTDTLIKVRNNDDDNDDEETNRQEVTRTEEGKKSYTTLRVHSYILRAHSDYFDAMCKFEDMKRQQQPDTDDPTSTLYKIDFCESEDIQLDTLVNFIDYCYSGVIKWTNVSTWKINNSPGAWQLIDLLVLSNRFGASILVHHVAGILMKIYFRDMTQRTYTDPMDECIGPSNEKRDLETWQRDMKNKQPARPRDCVLYSIPRLLINFASSYFERIFTNIPDRLRHTMRLANEVNTWERNSECNSKLIFGYETDEDYMNNLDYTFGCTRAIRKNYEDICTYLIYEVDECRVATCKYNDVFEYSEDNPNKFVEVYKFKYSTEVYLALEHQCCFGTNYWTFADAISKSCAVFTYEEQTAQFISNNCSTDQMEQIIRADPAKLLKNSVLWRKCHPNDNNSRNYVIPEPPTSTTSNDTALSSDVKVLTLEEIDRVLRSNYAFASDLGVMVRTVDHSKTAVDLITAMRVHVNLHNDEEKNMSMKLSSSRYMLMAGKHYNIVCFMENASYEIRRSFLFSTSNFHWKEMLLSQCPTRLFYELRFPMVEKNSKRDMMRERLRMHHHFTSAMDLIEEVKEFWDSRTAVTTEDEPESGAHIIKTPLKVAVLHKQVNDLDNCTKPAIIRVIFPDIIVENLEAISKLKKEINDYRRVKEASADYSSNKRQINLKSTENVEMTSAHPPQKDSNTSGNQSEANKVDMSGVCKEVQRKTQFVLCGHSDYGDRPYRLFDAGIPSACVAVAKGKGFPVRTFVGDECKKHYVFSHDKMDTLIQSHGYLKVTIKL